MFLWRSVRMMATSLLRSSMGFRFRRWPGFRCASSSTFFTICRPRAQGSQPSASLKVYNTLLLGWGPWDGLGSCPVVALTTNGLLMAHTTFSLCSWLKHETLQSSNAVYLPLTPSCTICIKFLKHELYKLCPITLLASEFLNSTSRTSSSSQGKAARFCRCAEDKKPTDPRQD